MERPGAADVSRRCRRATCISWRAAPRPDRCCLAAGILLTDVAAAVIDPRVEEAGMTAARRAGAAMVAALAAVTLGGSVLVSRSAGSSSPTRAMPRRCVPISSMTTGKWQRPVLLSAAPGEQARASICGRPQPADSAASGSARRERRLRSKTSAGHGCRSAPTRSAATSSLVSSSARGCRSALSVMASSGGAAPRRRDRGTRRVQSRSRRRSPDGSRQTWSWCSRRFTSSSCCAAPCRSC